jgi:uncharacterized protein YjbI with pentapeptide repeats
MSELVFALGAVVVVLLATWVLVVPRRLAPPVPDDVLAELKDDRVRLEVIDARTKLRNDIRTTALQAVAGLAVLAGAVLAFQQLTEDRQQAAATRQLSLQGQASERFTRAIDQLGSERREVQLGGIYGLEQIAQQAPDNRLAVTEVLVAYLHRRAPRPAKEPPGSSLDEDLRFRAPDIQAALTVLGRRQIEPNDPPLDLRTLDLRGADLGDAVLSGADIRNTDLRSADLRDADLRDANLEPADLRYADLTDADLSGASLDGALLEAAVLRRAVLRGADLHGRILITTDFTDADLSGASLFGAVLRAARLDGANLRSADLSAADLREARADQRTIWPDGFDWQGAGLQLVQSNTHP